MSTFRMPSLGADMEAGTLVEWLKRAGEKVARGDVIAVVETQKGAIEVEVFETGTLRELLVSEGATVPVGTPLATIEAEGAPLVAAPPTPAAVPPRCARRSRRPWRARSARSRTTTSRPLSTSRRQPVGSPSRTASVRRKRACCRPRRSSRRRRWRSGSSPSSTAPSRRERSVRARINCGLAITLRGGGLRSSELSEGTITVTSLGERGVEAVFGVIFPPQVALVGFGSPSPRPWVVGGGLAARNLLTATLSADHRVSDGHRGALFLAEIARLLEEPQAL